MHKNSTLRPKLHIAVQKRAGVHVHDMKMGPSCAGTPKNSLKWLIQGNLLRTAFRPKCHVRIEISLKWQNPWNRASPRMEHQQMPQNGQNPKMALVHLNMQNRTLEVQKFTPKDAKRMQRDVNGENACGYCGSKCMVFGQKVMERMYKTAWKEKCDANGEIACGYCGSKCMVFGQSAPQHAKTRPKCTSTCILGSKIRYMSSKNGLPMAIVDEKWGVGVQRNHKIGILVQ